MPQSFHRADAPDIAPNAIPLDDASLEAVSAAGGGKGLAILCRDVGRFIVDLFKSGSKQVALTDQKISTIHEMVGERAADRTA